MAATAWNVVAAAASKEILAADNYRHYVTVQLHEQAVPGANPVYLGFGEVAVDGEGVCLGGLGHSVRVRGAKARLAVNAIAGGNAAGGIETMEDIEYRHTISYPAWWDKPGQGPAVVHYDPVDGDPAVDAFDTTFTILFDRNVVVGAGSVVLHKTGVGAVETLDVANPLEVTAAGGMVTIFFTAPFDPDTAYHVKIDNGAITDVPGVAWAGINDETTWNFAVPLV